MYNAVFKYLLTGALCIVLSFVVKAQETDSLAIDNVYINPTTDTVATDNNIEIDEKEAETEKPVLTHKKTSNPKLEEPKKKAETVLRVMDEPTKATLYSAVLPGLGQAYNKKYWKIPIIYGAAAYFIYTIVDNHKLYTMHRDVLYMRDSLAFTQGYNANQALPNESEITSVLGRSDLRLRKDTYQNDRDMNVVYLLLLYAVNILDATVDAHLKGFKISEEFIMTMAPMAQPSLTGRGTLGLTLNFNLL